MDTQATRHRLQFGDFEFDRAAGELYRAGQRVRLQEKPRQVLAALLERPGEIATREQLRERLWSTDTFVDFEHGLNTAIKKVRQALGDSADAPAFVETIAKRGYRFIAPVVLSTPASVAGVPSQEPDVVNRPSAPTEPRRRWAPGPALRWAGGLILLLAIAVAIRAAWPGEDETAGHRQAPTAHLAVLPLRVLGDSDAGSASYIGIGIADAITTRLANIRQIALRPTSAVLPYKDGPYDPPRVANTLGVKYLLVGTILPAEQTYRISVQLVGADGVAVWGRTYDEPRTGLLELQDRIAEQVASALRIELSPPERKRLHVRYTQNPEAYDLYLRGRARLVNYTEANMREALDDFEQALALDQSYALARAALATGAAWFSVRYAYDEEALAWGERADREARRALDQDPHLADAHLAIASAAGTLYGGFNWKAVLDRTAEALRLDPSLDLAHVVRTRALYHVGRLEEAGAEAARARALNPFPNIETVRLDVALQLAAGEFEHAARRAAEVLDANRTDMPAMRHYLGLARYYTGDVAGARETLASVRRGGQPDVRSQASLASIEAATGMRDEARARVAEILRGSYMDHHVAYSVGVAYAQLGETNEALKWLERAAESGFPCYPWFQRDSLLAPIRRHPAFVRLLERVREQSEQSIRRSP